MAYTAVIDAATPATTDLVSSGDDEIRALKTAIIERFESIFADVDVDPLAAKTIKPAVNVTYMLGDATHLWHDVFSQAFVSVRGSTSALTATFTTIFAPVASVAARYSIVAQVLGGGTTQMGVCDIVSDGSGTLALFNKGVGASFDFQISGGNVQAKQSSGSTVNILWAALAIS